MGVVHAGYVEVPGSEQPVRGDERLIGPATGDEEMTVSVRVRRRPGAPPLPDMRHGGRAVTREELAATWGADDGDLDQVVAFGAEHGLKLVERSGPRRAVVFTGTVDQMSEAFAVQLGNYEAGDESYLGREGAVYVPDSLGEIVKGVFGLDQRQLLHRASVSPAFVQYSPTPPEQAVGYEFPTGVDGTGETIGILEFGGGYNPSDLNTFFKGLSLSTPSVTPVTVTGAGNQPGTGGSGEVTVDIDTAGSVAPGAKIVVYFSVLNDFGLTEAISTAVTDATHEPSVLSISWGISESGCSQQLFTDVNDSLKGAAAGGVTVFAATGDWGSTYANPPASDKRAHVNYPASDPFVTACGGTILSDLSGTSFTENTWGTTGGGVSDQWPLPPWQAFAGVPKSANGDGRVGRGVPDIAGNAGPYSITVGGAASPITGTSLVAPFYAGLVALINQSLGEPVGYLNPILYSLDEGFVFRDIDDGISNAAGNGIPGYQSGPGWDACTGLGSVKGSALLLALRGVGAPPGVATDQNSILLAWKGENRDSRIWSSQMSGGSWATEQAIDGANTSEGCSLATFGSSPGLWVMAFKGDVGDPAIYTAMSPDGRGWTTPTPVPGMATSAAPSLAASGWALHMAWKGEMADEHIYWSYTADGKTWQPQVSIAGVETSHRPALAAYQGKVYAAWKGTSNSDGSDEHIYYASFDGQAWSAQKGFDGLTSSGPSLAVFGEDLYMAWKGEDGDERIWYSSFNGTSWSEQAVTPGFLTSIGPSLVSYAGALKMFWKGEAGDQKMWNASFDGQRWGGQAQVANFLTGPFAA